MWAGLLPQCGSLAKPLPARSPRSPRGGRGWCSAERSSREGWSRRYLSHFGLKAFPFQLQPDPVFLFESCGYHYSHQYLRYGLMQKSGFVVLTGEIGAGKTTLTQAFLAEIDPSRVAAAILVSTQLDAGNLLLAIGQVFGFALPQVHCRGAPGAGEPAV